MPFFCNHIVARRRGQCPRAAILLLSGLALAAAPPAAAMPQAAAAERPISAHPFAHHIAEAALRFGIPEHWIVAVMRAESAGDRRAISSAGAMGLMQVMPATWAELRTRYLLGGDPYNPRDNILAGAAYLREMFDRYGNVAAMLAAYNAGPTRYDAYLTVGRPLPAETRAYVALLVPALGGEALAADASLPPPPPNWRDAPLFVARLSDRPAAADVQSNNRQPAATAPPEPVADQQSKALFVTRSGNGERP